MLPFVNPPTSYLAALGPAHRRTDETQNRGVCRKALTRTGRWVKPFLEALAGGGNIKDACAAAGVSRATAYRHRADDPAFARQWGHALDDYADLLHAEMFRRAVEGVERPVHHRGKVVGSVREYSDYLLLHLARAARPEKFAPNTAAGQAGGEAAEASGEELVLCHSSE